MKRLIVLFSASLALSALPGCAHAPQVIKDFSICVEKGVSSQVASIITDVEHALATGSYYSLLVDIGKRVGFTAVDCAVQEVMNNAKAQYAAAPNARLAKLKIDNGAAWLHRS